MYVSHFRRRRLLRNCFGLRTAGLAWMVNSPSAFHQTFQDRRIPSFMSWSIGSDKNSSDMNSKQQSDLFNFLMSCLLSIKNKYIIKHFIMLLEENNQWRAGVIKRSYCYHSERHHFLITAQPGELCCSYITAIWKQRSVYGYLRLLVLTLETAFINVSQKTSLRKVMIHMFWSDLSLLKNIYECLTIIPWFVIE